MFKVTAQNLNMLYSRFNNVSDKAEFKGLAPSAIITDVTVEEILDLSQGKRKFLDLGKQRLGNSNFFYNELILSSTADQHGFENRVPEDESDIVDRAIYLAENAADVIRAKYGSFTPTSWYRGEDLEWYLTHATDSAGAGGFITYIRKTYEQSSSLFPMASIIEVAKNTKFLTQLLALSTGEARIVLALWKLYFANKKHPKGEAMDVKINAAKSVPALYNWIRDESKIRFDQLIIEMHKKSTPMSGWVHISMIDESRNDGRTNKLQAFSVN
jgi:hypothetical protein